MEVEVTHAVHVVEGLADLLNLLELLFGTFGGELVQVALEDAYLANRVGVVGGREAAEAPLVVLQHASVFVELGLDSASAVLVPIQDGLEGLLLIYGLKHDPGKCVQREE